MDAAAANNTGNNVTRAVDEAVDDVREAFNDAREAVSATSDKIKKSLRRRSTHLTAEVSTREKQVENDDALKNELARLEAIDSTWKHPMGFKLLAALRILNAPADPVLNDTGEFFCRYVVVCCVCCVTFFFNLIHILCTTYIIIYLITS